MLPLLVALGLAAQAVDVKPLGETVPEPHQTDDPAIWTNPRNPADSLILGTVKMAAPNGAISVYRRDGTRLQRISDLDRPNNIDVGYGLQTADGMVDIAVATERNQNRLRVFSIDGGKGLQEMGTIPVFAGPMGIALYKRRSDQAVFAIVSRKAGPSGSYLWQYRLRVNAAGRIEGEKVREFGLFSGSKEIEAVTVDPEGEHVYYSDEGAGIRKYHADPEHPDAARELALFGTAGWKGDREGLAVHRGYLIATDQQRSNSEFHVFQLDGLREVGVFRVGADTTDGIDISSNGLFVAMNDSRHNFILAEWKAIAAALGLR